MRWLGTYVTPKGHVSRDVELTGVPGIVKGAEEAAAAPIEFLYVKLDNGEVVIYHKEGN